MHNVPANTVNDMVAEPTIPVHEVAVAVIAQVAEAAPVRSVVLAYVIVFPFTMAQLPVVGVVNTTLMGPQGMENRPEGDNVARLAALLAWVSVATFVKPVPRQFVADPVPGTNVAVRLNVVVELGACEQHASVSNKFRKNSRKLIGQI